jgi:hypothetical protein
MWSRSRHILTQGLEEMRAEKEGFEREEEWARDGIRMDDSALYCDRYSRGLKIYGCLFDREYPRE